MDPLTIFLLTGQAGMAYMDYREGQDLAKLGYDVEQAGIEANLELAKTAAEQESLASIQALNKNFGAQMAIQAARGTATNIGSAFFISQESIGAYNADEQSRQLNLAAQKASIHGKKAASALGFAKTSKDLSNQFTKRMADLANSMPTGGGGQKQAPVTTARPSYGLKQASV